MGREELVERFNKVSSEMADSKGRPVVSVVVVNYNAGALLRETINAVLSSTIPVEIIISDNGSSDGSLSELRQAVSAEKRLSIIENKKNLGFAQASNIALAQARGELVLLLNPDAVVLPDTLARMVAALETHPDAGMAGCFLRNPDGTEQAGCRRSVPTPWRSVVRVLHLDKLLPKHPRFRNFVLTDDPLPDKPVYLEAISGAFMLVRREALEDVGFLDDNYFMHCEDLDWCMRFNQANWKILFVPDVEVIHYRGTCSKNRSMFVLWHKHKGMIRFYRKFFNHQYPWPLMLLVMMAVWTRFVLLAGWTFIWRKKEDHLLPHVSLVRQSLFSNNAKVLKTNNDSHESADKIDTALLVSRSKEKRQNGIQPR